MTSQPDGDHAQTEDAVPELERDAPEQRVLSRLEAGHATKAQLKKVVGPSHARTLDAVLAHLLGEARIFAHYKPLQTGLPSKTLVGYALEPPASPPASAWVSNVVEEFEQTAARAAVFGLTREALLAELLRAANLDPEAMLRAVLQRENVDVRALLLSAARELGVSLGRASHRPAARHSVPPARHGAPPARHSVPPASRKTDTEIVLQVLSELCRHAAAQSMPIAQLRSATELAKPRFDRAVLVLASFGSIELVPHARTDSLTAQQQTELLIDQRGSPFSHVIARVRR